MNVMPHDVWQRKGSSIVFDRKCLAPLIAGGALVSLRQALAWLSSTPADPPVPGSTIVVSGLETIVETREPDVAEEFLRHRVRPLVIELQRQWVDCGIVFGFTTHPKSFEVTSLTEEVLYVRRDRKTVRLSDGLWDGSATANMMSLVREGERPGEGVTVGYYVARIS